MHRLLVALLAALDAVIAAAVGVAAALAPLTLLWVFGLGAPVWSALWPASAAVWQLGHFVPQSIALPATYLAAAGIPPEASSFTLSLAPLAYACFTAIFAARSGRRAALAGTWGTGVLSGGFVFAVISTGIWLTSRTPIAGVHGWQAVLFPVIVFVAPALVGAVLTAWRNGDGGIVDRLHDRVDGFGGAWREVPALAVRGAGIVLVGLIGVGALEFVIALIARGGEAVALYEAGHLNAVGVIVVSLAQFAYLPTLVVWGMSFVAGPGFAVGVGTAVSPSGTQLGVVPGIPILGALPASTPSWLLVVVIIPVAVAAFAGWVLRSRLASSGERESVGVQLGLTGAVALLSALGAALLAMVASGSIGPDRLAQVGPEPGALALSVGVEVLIGAGILLLSPRRHDEFAAFEAETPVDAAPAPAESPLPVWPPVGRSAFADEIDLPAPGKARRPRRSKKTREDEQETAPIAPGFVGAVLVDHPPTAPTVANTEDDKETAPIDPGFLRGPAEPDADRGGGRPPVD